MPMRATLQVTVMCEAVKGAAAGRRGGSSYLAAGQTGRFHGLLHAFPVLLVTGQRLHHAATEREPDD